MIHLLRSFRYLAVVQKIDTQAEYNKNCQVDQAKRLIWTQKFRKVCSRQVTASESALVRDRLDLTGIRLAKE